MESVKIGLDIGSVAAKAVVIDQEGKVLFCTYRRHNAAIAQTALQIIEDITTSIGSAEAKIALSGSAAMGLAERCGFAFIQEVLALSNYANNINDKLHTIIDIGGEDAKIIFLDKGHLPDMRMNGNCAGGTGAFIDQMALILGLSIEEMDQKAQEHKQLYPIASRCGVFSKTDVQNLVAKNIPTSDICASIFHAIAVQVVSSLSRGKDINPLLMFAGGPLTFIQSLRDAFIDYLSISERDLLNVSDANILVAKGCIFEAEKQSESFTLEEIKQKIIASQQITLSSQKSSLPPLFESKEEYERWKKEKQSSSNLKSIKDYCGDAFLGIDSGSTTTKITLCDTQDNIIFSYYAKNMGNPIEAVLKGLKELQATCEKQNANPVIECGASTGYGQDLIKAAFGLQSSLVETIAHYRAAKKILPSVDFILDIGGQDMKAMYIEDGVLNRIELNEACSSGCGSFIETFAGSLGYSVQDFATKALFAPSPCDLGTRCTVFMNSKVKQYLREGLDVANISAGLSYSVVKNCLFKVLKVKDSSLGKHIVVQGGTMKNDSVVRAFEKMLSDKVFRSQSPELMGAYGCSLFAKEIFDKQENKASKQSLILTQLLKVNEYTSKQSFCKGCENQCLISTYRFANGNTFHSGNKCEKIFSSNDKVKPSNNIYDYKYKRLFAQREVVAPNLTIGIPRVLNMFEDFPFWTRLFETCNIKVILSDTSSYVSYEKSLNQITSENICFPAKLTHSHIDNLIQRGITHIFFPYTVYEQKQNETDNNSYNCPIVSSYNVVIKHLKDKPQYNNVRIDNPIFSFKNLDLLKHNCKKYLLSLGVENYTIDKAFKEALKAKADYEKDIKDKNIEYLHLAQQKHTPIILLAGRPYHTDPLIQHNLSEIIASMGVTVINEDIVRGEDASLMQESYTLSQWAFINRITLAALFVAEQNKDVNFVQMTSFGCGPDAFLLDDVQNILKRYGKSATQIKIDDISNVGSMKLRIKSLIESLKLQSRIRNIRLPFIDTKPFGKQEKKRKILAPFFTDYLSPLLPELFTINGYDLEVLPKSDEQSIEYGLKYCNNEVCYPATLIVGDVIKALESGKYNPEKIAIGITQTGGQCRASNYYAVIRKALVDSGFKDIPVISVNFSSGTSKMQDGFSINWIKTLPIALGAILFGDALSRLYYSSIVRSPNPKEVQQLQNKYLSLAKAVVLTRNPKELKFLLTKAVGEFNSILPSARIECQKVGIVGEIFLKYHSFANKDVVDWLIGRGIEVVPPTLITFFLQTFVNNRANKKESIEKSKIPDFIMNFAYSLCAKQVASYNKILSDFKYFNPIDDIFELSKDAKDILPITCEFGEGWLLPAEIVNFVKNKVNTVVSLQPFGCIANHIISKGVENKIKALFPDLNYLALDFDAGVSEVNVKNRLLLLLSSIK